ncbi:uncharacterized protein LOC120048091 [Salvelinus namaycush]|uniref:Uncharacterized protein LOC120048091 n=1 Tax=Salvelinus namaycush TaxID=8040 RepID=A0A8U0UEF7_SALNM|nr:uncharacterized protein LOC120048091 [Salvelinus namaycush]
MSQPSPSVDTQTLLQSMLQRLRLQPGSETQHGRQDQAPHGPTTAAQGQGEDGGRPWANAIDNGALGLSPADDVRAAEGKGGCEKARKREMRRLDSREEFGIPVWNCNFGGSSRKGKEEEGRKQPTGSLPKLDRGHMVSSPSAAQGAAVLVPSQNAGSVRGDPGGSVGALPTVMTFTGTQTGNEGYIDASPLSNSSLSSKTKGSQNHDRSVLMTSNSDFIPFDMGTQMERWRTLGNGGSEVPGHGDVMKIMSPGQGVAENTSSTKSMKRLTQRIKEKWRDRQGSLGKKRKAEDGVREERKDAKQVKFQLSTRDDNVTKMPNKEGYTTTQSPIREGQGEAPPTLSEDSGTLGQFRSPSSFEFGLGSFSLLEEIFTGQEWARFLNPSQVDTLANQTPAEEVTNQLETSQSRPQDHESGRSTMTLDRVSQSGNVNSQWDFRQSELDQSYDRSADVSSSVNMNITEPSLVQEQNSKCELIQSAPKEYGHVQSQTSSDEVRPNHIPVLEFSFIKPVEVLDSSALKSRVHMNRKREHQSQERKDEREFLKGEGGERLEDNSVPSDEEEREEGDNFMMPVYPLKSSLSPLPPSSPSSSSTSHPLVTRSILRHSVFQDSESSLSMETVTKKRRMSKSRHVRFSEEVVTMPPSLLIQQYSDSEEDCGTEEDSTLEENAVMEEVKVMPMMSQPAAVLPAWILALRRKTRKKHRH